jgi:hypothetical protein
MKTKFAFLTLLALIVFSCGDDETAYNCKDCVNSPEAAAANDASGKGIYKGLVIGSSGTIKFDIANSGTTITALLELDGETYNLEADGTYNPEWGFEGLLYGTMNTTDDIIIGFWTTADGIEYGVWIESLPGHDDANIEIYKEYSDSLVKVYEGTFSGDASGVFNMIVQDGEWEVLAREESDNSDTYFYGTVANGTMTMTCQCDIELTGKFSGDEASGKWDDGTSSGSWKGKRTL